MTHEQLVKTKVPMQVIVVAREGVEGGNFPLGPQCSCLLFLPKTLPYNVFAFYSLPHPKKSGT